MSIYTLLVKPGETADEDFVCLSERFDWFAFLLPPVWATSNRLWRELALMLLGLAAALTAGIFFVLPAVALYFLFALWLGFEAGPVHMRALERRGWRVKTELIAASQDMAESRFWRRRSAGDKPLVRP